MQAVLIQPSIPKLPSAAANAPDASPVTAPEASFGARLQSQTARQHASQDARPATKAAQPDAKKQPNDSAKQDTTGDATAKAADPAGSAVPADSTQPGSADAVTDGTTFAQDPDTLLALLLATSSSGQNSDNVTVTDVIVASPGEGNDVRAADSTPGTLLAATADPVTTAMQAPTPPALPALAPTTPLSTASGVDAGNATASAIAATPSANLTMPATASRSDTSTTPGQPGTAEPSFTAAFSPRDNGSSQTETVLSDPSAAATSSRAALRPDGAPALAQPAQALTTEGSEAVTAAVSQSSPAQAAASSTASAAKPAVQTPVGTPGWGSEIAGHVLVAVHRGAQTAELSLNPPQLGRLDVVINVQGDTANAIFVSPSATVRDALEQALPSLRDALAQAGLSLGQADVSAQQQRHDQTTGGRVWNGGGPATPEGDPREPITSARVLGLVDTFA